MVGHHENSRMNKMDLFYNDGVKTAFGFTFTAINTVVSYLEIIFSGRHADCFIRTSACASATGLTFIGVYFVHSFSFKTTFVCFFKAN